MDPSRLQSLMLGVDVENWVLAGPGTRELSGSKRVTALGVELLLRFVAPGSLFSSLFSDGSPRKSISSDSLSMDRLASPEISKFDSLALSGVSDGTAKCRSW